MTLCARCDDVQPMARYCIPRPREITLCPCSRERVTGRRKTSIPSRTTATAMKGCRRRAVRDVTRRAGITRRCRLRSPSACAASSRPIASDISGTPRPMYRSTRTIAYNPIFTRGNRDLGSAGPRNGQTPPSRFSLSRSSPTVRLAATRAPSATYTCGCRSRTTGSLTRRRVRFRS